jgi:hypothetical protein
MLVDGGAAVNLMSYSIFKKLERKDDELMKTNLTLNDNGGNSMEARGVISMELTIGSKSLATAFFAVEVQGNYSVILGCNWIHGNRCIPSTLHQFLIQWIDDEVEVVHVDASAYIALADATVDWQHGTPSDFRGRILPAMIFLVSPRMDLFPYLCSQLPKLDLEVYFSNRGTKKYRMVTASHATISVYYERYEQGYRTDKFRICKEYRCQGRLMGSGWRSIILAFGKTLELENGR